MEALRTRLRDLTADAVGLLAGIGDARTLGLAADADITGLLTEVEGLVRVADALAVLVAGEAGWRSRPLLGTEGLAHRAGSANAVELVERAARIDRATARRRLKLGGQVLPTFSIHGQVCPADFPTVRAGLVTGGLGVDSATVITTKLSTVRAGLPMDGLGGVRVAEHELVCAALGVSPEPGAPALPPVLPAETGLQADTWLQGLDPDGAEPSFPEFESRGFSFGHSRGRGGLVPIRGLLLPEVAGQLQRAFDALTNPKQSLKFLTEQERAELEDSGARDPRSKSQRQHDALATVVEVVGRCGELPTLGGASATMLVTVTADDYADGQGVGHVDGIEPPISMAAVRQLCCANGVQPIELFANGKVHRLGTTERCFNRSQRRALAVRDGGCIIPGCPIPAWACEAHHVIAWEDGGTTQVDNGVLLCWFHHRTIETSGWGIRMIDGAPQVKPPPWLGVPEWRPAGKSPTRAAVALRSRHPRN